MIRRGSVILNKGSGQSYVVVDMVGGVPIATRTIQIMNPSEWEELPCTCNRSSICECGDPAGVKGYCDVCLMVVNHGVP